MNTGRLLLSQEATGQSVGKWHCLTVEHLSAVSFDLGSSAQGIQCWIWSPGCPWCWGLWKWACPHQGQFSCNLAWKRQARTKLAWIRVRLHPIFLCERAELLGQSSKQYSLDDGVDGNTDEPSIQGWHVHNASCQSLEQRQEKNKRRIKSSFLLKMQVSTTCCLGSTGVNSGFWGLTYPPLGWA